MARLVVPSVKYQTSFLSSLHERQHEPLHGYLKTLLKSRHYQRPDLEAWLNQNFPHYINTIRRRQTHSLFTNRPYYQYWLVNRQEFIGQAILRLPTSNQIPLPPGHIGFYIRPSLRGRGYGRLILQKTLFKAKKLSFNRVLLTCKSQNFASQAVIQKNGGVVDQNLLKRYPHKRCYWITL